MASSEHHLHHCVPVLLNGDMGTQSGDVVGTWPRPHLGKIGPRWLVGELKPAVRRGVFDI